MSRDNGFLQLRRGFWEHVRDGRMSITEALAFVYICSEADTRNGIWKGSAKSLSGEIGIPDRTARDLLEKMEHGDYIRRFAVPGRHTCYPILVHKYLITSGPHTGEHLNALESISPTDLCYFPRQQDGEHSDEHGVQHGAAQRRSKNIERKQQNPAAARPADPRYQPFFVFAYESYSAKHRRKPLWQGKEHKALQTLLKSHTSEDLPLGRLKDLWGNFSASTEPFTVNQGDSLAYFCSNLDKFSDGPILAATGAKLNASAVEARNRAAAGFPVN